MISIAAFLGAAASAQAAIPANDGFANAQVVGPGLPAYSFESNSGATKEAGEPNHAGNPGGHSVWFSWTPTTSGPVDIGACGEGPGFDTLLAVYTGSAVGALTQVASNDDGPGCPGGSGSDVIFNATSGTTYRIAVDSKGTTQGSFQLSLIGTPANDDFADAEPILIMGTFLIANNEFGTKETGEPDHAGDPGGHSVWFSWTASTSKPVRLRTDACSNGLDTLLAVYTGSALNALTPIAGNDDSGTGCNPANSDVTFNATSGTTYWIAVDSKGGEGRFNLWIEGSPANDDFAAAELISPSLPASTSGTTNLATKEAGEPDHAGNPGGHSVWYSWTPSSSGKVALSVSSCFGGLDAPLAGVYTGSAVNDLTPVVGKAILHASGCPFLEPDGAEFSASAGTTYWIAVDGANGAQGSFQLSLTPPPANDDFGAAQTIGPAVPQTVSGTTRMATAQAGEPDHAGQPGGHSVWYSWTPAVSARVQISTCAEFSSLDSLVAVYTGSALNSLTPLAANDDGPSPDSSPLCRATDGEVEFDAVAGTTYRIAVDGAGGTIGRFSLRIRSHPENDDFANPQVLSSSLPVYPPESTNRMATKQAGEPDHAGPPGGHSVWFSWTPTSSGLVEVSTCASGGGELDTVLAVYTGSSLGTLSLVAADDSSATRCPGTDSAVRFTANAGTTYRIAVDGRDGTQGRFGLRIEGPPANDAFANAQAIPPGPSSYANGSTWMASKQAGEPDHGGQPGGHSVWFSWTPSSSGPATISLCAYSETSADGLLAIYTGSTVNTLTAVASAGDLTGQCGYEGGEVQFEASAGTTYWIAIDGKGAAEFAFSLGISREPTNDEFTAPDVLASSPMTAGGTTRFATKQASEPDHAGQPGGHSVWYSWTPTSSGPVDITACGHSTGLDTLLAVYTGSAVSALTPIAASDDTAAEPSNEFCEWNSHDSEVEFVAAAGTTYRIAVDSKASVGSFGLAFERAPSNDAFAAATAIEGSLPGYGSAVTKLASKQAGEPNHAGDPGGRSVWYSWTPSSSGPVAISTCTQSGDFDALLAVYTGSELANLSPVVSNDDGSVNGCRPSDSRVQFAAVAGTTYRIAVDGKAASWGLFQLTLEGQAANDEFGKPQPLGGGLPSSGSFTSNLFATKQASEPEHAGDPGGASVWFKWTAPRSGPVSVEACGSSFDTLLAVYTGTAINALSPVASNDDSGGKCAPQSKLGFEAVANTVYRIAVDGKAGAQGAIELHIDGSPKNDDFAGAEVIPGSGGWYWPGSTVLATKQAGEQNHAGNAGGHSVWFSWTPSQSDAVEIDACTSTFNVLLAIYTGASVDGLTPVATTEAGVGECEEGRSIWLDAIAGTTYRLAVDGADGETGHFELHFRAATAPTHALGVSTGGSGIGSVTSSPAGIDCGSICSHDYAPGATVALTATPAAGSTFAGWSGGGCSGTGTCQVTLGTDTMVTANFAVQASGGGSGDNPIDGLGPPNGPARKPLRCKPGFRKVRVHGKAKCVKKRPKHHRHHRSRR